MIEKSSTAMAGLDTDSLPRPGDFVLGSAASRAAARARLNKQSPSSHRISQNMLEASQFCWKCFLSGISWTPSELNDRHYDPDRGEYRYLEYSVEKHLEIGAEMTSR